MDGLAFRCASCGGINRVRADKRFAGPKCGRCQARLETHGHPVDVSDDELASLVRSSPVPVLVDFWAAWCGPCRAVAPVLHAVGEEHAGHLIVAKVDTDAHQRTAAELQVRGIPTLALYKGGKLVAIEAGAKNRAQVEAFLQR